LGASFVRKPLYSREGANVSLISGGIALAQQDGPYGGEGFVRQAFASLQHFDGQYPVLGSWLVDHTPCGLSIREDESPITGNNSRFLPHAIV
jgi:glutathionylspermidine synthase